MSERKSLLERLELLCPRIFFYSKHSSYMNQLAYSVKGSFPLQTKQSKYLLIYKKKF